ncbi:MAG: ABC transporter permease [Limnochordales bacterium]|nr:ABC transporter permease [Limnochordales bacterium]
MTYLAENWDTVLQLTWEHIYLAGVALLVSVAVALPVGAVLARFERLATVGLGLLSVIYTIPSMALFALLIPVTGLGFKTAAAALVAYSQFILVRNTVAGLRGVDPAILEAAAGMGMSGWQLFRDVRLPLAMPVILAGVRVASVSIIGLASLAAWINAGGLGVLLFQGLYQDHAVKIWTGTVLIGLVAIGMSRLIERLERRARAWLDGVERP